MLRPHRLPLALMGSVLLLMLFGPPPVYADAKVQTFALEEHFGVSHQLQVVTFDLAKELAPGNCYLLNDANEEVPCQKVAGGRFGAIAVSMDLPANSSRKFTLMSGRAPKAFPGGVGVNEANEGYIEITNGLTGVRVPKVYAPLTTTPKCPIQGVRFRDGSWSPPGTPVSFVNSNREGGITSVDSMTVKLKRSKRSWSIVETASSGMVTPDFGLSYSSSVNRPPFRKGTSPIRA